MFIYIVDVFVDSLFILIQQFWFLNGQILIIIFIKMAKSFDILVHLYFYSNKFMYSHVSMKDLKLYNVYNIFEF